MNYSESDIKTSIPQDSALHRKASALLQAAYDFWEERQRVGKRGAVVWLETEDGHFVLFTRGEYLEQITEQIPMIQGPDLFEPFLVPTTTHNEAQS